MRDAAFLVCRYPAHSHSFSLYLPSCLIPADIPPEQASWRSVWLERPGFLGHRSRLCLCSSACAPAHVTITECVAVLILYAEQNSDNYYGVNFNNCSSIKLVTQKLQVQKY